MYQWIGKSKHLQPTKNKAIIKLSEKYDYWKPFVYRGRTYMKTFQYSVLRVK